MAVIATQGPLTGLPRRLVQDGIVSEDILTSALEEIGGKSANLVPHLVGKQLGDARQIAIAAAHEFGVPLLYLGLDARDSIGSAVSEVVNDAPSNKSIVLIIAGVLAAVSGLAGLVRSKG
jgi:hypothetical protein